MGSTIDLITDVAAVVGEGPVWDGTSGTLYWADIHTGRRFNCNPATNENWQIYQGINVGGLRLNQGGEIYRIRDVGFAGKPEFETKLAWPAKS